MLLDGTARRLSFCFALLVAGAFVGNARQDEPVPAPSLERAPRVLPAREARSLGVGSYVDDAEGIGLDGERAGWRSGAGERGTVVVLTSLTCPLCAKFSPEVARVSRTYTERGFGFVHVAVAGLDAIDELRAHAERQGLAGLVLDDADGAVARAFDARTTTEVFVLDASGTLTYRGALSDRYGIGYALAEPRHRYLEDALDALLRGETAHVAATTAPGCLLERRASTGLADEHEAPTYARDVARIVRANCAECHRAGGPTPFALETYEDVARRASMIAAVVSDRSMPPWFAAPSADGDSPWRNDRSLLDDEVRTILEWVDAGAPRGDDAVAPPPLARRASDWELGEPDAVFTIPRAVDVPAEGVVEYQYLVLPTGLDEDRWVRAIEVRPTAPEVTHHVLAFVLPGDAIVDGRMKRWDLLDETRGFFAGWAPGTEPEVLPEGYAKKLPAGSILMFELHYTTNGRPATDRTSIGVHFADAPPQHVVRCCGVSNHRIRIPAGAEAHREESLGVFAHDAELLAFFPHMHLRGRSFTFDVTTPGGEPVRVLEVPRYDFNWQYRYVLDRPLPVPASTRIEVAGVYDNSASNLANPDPSIDVRWGRQTDEEMLIGFVEYVLAEEQLDVPANEPLVVVVDPIERERLLALDRDGDGRVARAEVPPRLQRGFDLLDTDDDGFVDGREFPGLGR
ncbi:MAG: redoxin family protein [Planctomycetota bacterium]